MKSKNSNPKFTGERQIFHYTFLFDAYDETSILTGLALEELPPKRNSIHSQPDRNTVLMLNSYLKKSIELKENAPQYSYHRYGSFTAAVFAGAGNRKMDRDIERRTAVNMDNLKT